jgi:hypothetical protein
MNDKEKLEYAYLFSDVLKEETQRIAEIRRNRFGSENISPADIGHSGLALSGGGIRSAAFGLGILHALHNQRLLRHIDYLSTVSGGGYIGSALTFFAATHAKADRSSTPSATSGSSDPSVVGDLLGTAFVGAKTDKGEKNLRLDHIRRQGNYLSQGDRLGIGSMLAMVLRSCLVGVAIWLPIAALALVVMVIASLPLEIAHHHFFDDVPLADVQGTPTTGQASDGTAGSTQRYSVMQIETTLDIARGQPSTLTLEAQLAAEPIKDQLLVGETLVYLIWPAAFCFLLLGLNAVVTCVSSDLRPVDESYGERLAQQRWFGKLLRLGLGLLVIASLPLAVDVLNYFGASLVDGSIVAALGSVVGGITAFQAFQRTASKGGSGAINLAGLLASSGAGLMLYAGLILALLFAHSLLELAGWSGTWGPEHRVPFFWGVGLLVGLAIVSLWVAYRTDLNIIALHRLYRDRLMETFLPNAADAGGWHAATEAERFWLADACAATSVGPYHLINSNVVLARSEDTGYSGRGGDGFVLSPLFCGCDATGWCPTAEWIQFPSNEKGNPDRFSLATAMAVSAAAVNPHAGVSGKGPTRNRLVSAAMNLMNIRLGYWAPNPNPDKRLPVDSNGFTRKPTWLRVLPTMLLGGSKGKPPPAHSETAPFVELTDGGHFENLGIYELVRRRVKVIIVADAGCDPTFGYADLGNAIERCRVDFGVSIRFEDEAFDLRHLAPLPSDDPLQKVFPLARRGVAIGRIRYPGLNGTAEPEMGFLVFIKTTLTQHLPADIYAHKQADPSFPDQSTGDQWFDEAQFEAYRELGYSLFENFIDEFAKSCPERTAVPLPSDRFGYGALIDWLHGRGWLVAGKPAAPTARA